MKGRIVYILVVFLFVFFILKNLNEGQRLIEVVLKAKWEFLLLAIILQIIRFMITAIIYQKSLGLFGINWKLKSVTPLTLASQAINIFAPLAPLPGSSIFIHKARQENLPALKIAAAMLFLAFNDYLALLPFLLLSLYLQIKIGNIHSYEIVGILIFIFLLTCLFLILIFGVVSPKLLKLIFKLIEKIVNKLHSMFKKRRFFADKWAEKRALLFQELSEGLLSFKKKKRVTLALAIARNSLDLLTLYVLIIAFGVYPALSVVIIGYTLTMLFSIVSPTPQGTGFVETIIPAVFKSLGILIGPATLAVLLWRGLNLWLPAIVGFFFMHPAIRESNTE